MRHLIEDYTTADLIAAINSKLHTIAWRNEAMAEYYSRKCKEHEGLADVVGLKFLDTHCNRMV